MATFTDVETSIQNSEIVYCYRNTETIFASGCVVWVDEFGNIHVVAESADADLDQIRSALTYY